jgi:hypothetical protein
VVHDARTSALVAAVPVLGGSLGLLDRDEQTGRLDAWRAVLASMARSGGSLQRIQWVERSGPLRTDAQPPNRGSGRLLCPEAIDSYGDLVEGRAPSRAHEVLLALAVAASGSRRSLPNGALEELRRELRLLDGQLRRADLLPGPVLAAAELRRALEPDAVSHVAFRGSRRSSDRGAMASLDQWAALRSDGQWHATYWISEWPRVDVGADFLSPLLVAEGRRAVALVMGAVPFERAIRQARSARTADLADEEIRSRAGFLPSARRRREAEGATIREEELADGHVEYRFSGYVTVTASDRDSLAHSCAETEQAAQECRLEIRRLYGRQAEAYTWTLPLTRGLA